MLLGLKKIEIALKFTREIPLKILVGFKNWGKYELESITFLWTVGW